MVEVEQPSWSIRVCVWARGNFLGQEACCDVGGHGVFGVEDGGEEEGGVESAGFLGCSVEVGDVAEGGPDTAGRGPGVGAGCRGGRPWPGRWGGAWFSFLVAST